MIWLDKITYVNIQLYAIIVYTKTKAAKYDTFYLGQS